jgi:hypothetical protein
MFGSIGMYAGILLGIYVITTSPGPTPYEGPDTYEDFSLNRGSLLAPGTSLMAKRENRAIGNFAPNLHFNFIQFQF